jgi:hypothetical protein
VPDPDMFRRGNTDLAVVHPLLGYKSKHVRFKYHQDIPSTFQTSTDGSYPRSLHRKRLTIALFPRRDVTHELPALSTHEHAQTRVVSVSSLQACSDWRYSMPL